MRNEGPTTHTITERRTTCGLCKYHECTGGLFTRIGGGGYREWACNHPDAYPQETDPEKAEIRGMLRALDKGGRPIGRTETTPQWCPFLREQNTKDEPRR